MKALDATELVQLTGYKHGSKQARWCRDNLGLEPAIGRDGHPRITWFVIEHAQLARRTGADAPTPAAPTLGWTPNWRKAA